MHSCRADICRPCLHHPRAHTVSACGATSPVAKPEANTASGAGPAAFSPALTPVQAGARVIAIPIAEDTDTPTGATVKATAEHPIVLEFIRFHVDQLHPDSIPEDNFDVQANPGLAFEITDDLPGRADVSLRDLHRAATIVQVQL